MMALLLPQCAPPESLHRLANVRQRSRKSARVTHGATESSASTKAFTDHFRIPSTEPCCNLISPLLLTPLQPVRRSSRLRVRRGHAEDVTTHSPSDKDAAEWISRVLANNGVVEVDPVTMAEHYGSSSESSDFHHSRSPGFPSRVPLAVVLAAGAAVALAVIALLIQALHRQSDGSTSTSSNSDGSNLTNSFKGKPLAPDLSSKVSHQARDSKEVLASSAATGASFFQLGNFLGRNKTPSPSSGDKSWSQGKYDSVTPFFSSDRASTSYSKPAPPPPDSRWPDEKYKSVRPFFPDEVAAASTEDQGSPGKSENGSSPNKTTTPFFPDEQQGSANAEKTASSQSVPPFFPDEQQGSTNAKKAASLQSVPPFFPDEQQSRNGPSLDAVEPFFADERGRNATAGVSASEGIAEVKPFFPDEQVGTASGKGASRQSSSKPKMSWFWDGIGSSKAQRDASAASTKTVDARENAPVKATGGKPQVQHKETPELARALSAEELALLEDIKTEEEKRFAKMQALQAAFPALAIGAGAVGALVGVDGAFEMVGITATASFVSYELLWANKRKELLDEITSITDHHKLFNFLQKRKIVKDDC